MKQTSHLRNTPIIHEMDGLVLHLEIGVFSVESNGSLLTTDRLMT